MATVIEIGKASMAAAIEPLCLQAEAGEDTWPVHDGQGELLGHIDYHDALDNRRNLQPMEADGTTPAPTLYADWPDDTREEAEIYICDIAAFRFVANRPPSGGGLHRR